MARHPVRRASSDFKRLKSEYDAHLPKANRLMLCMRDQLEVLLHQNNITLGVPMEARVKTWASIDGKLRRKGQQISCISDVSDIVGLRLILLFRDDVERMHDIITSTLCVRSFENTGDRLAATQFGYRSNHYNFTIPDSWSSLPSYSDLGEVEAELQVRTLSQHIWAAASHKLQYKHEESVPPSLIRSIHRVSALLELVDLEFERILEARRDYGDAPSGVGSDTVVLNVDSLKNIMNEMLPQENIDRDEDYDEVLRDLYREGYAQVAKFRNALTKGLPAALMEDKRIAANTVLDEDEERRKRGVYFTHCGLVRMALNINIVASSEIDDQ